MGESGKENFSQFKDEVGKLKYIYIYIVVGEKEWHLCVLKWIGITEVISFGIKCYAIIPFCQTLLLNWLCVGFFF